MHLAKPSWLAHLDDKNQRTSIFSIHVHPDGTRIATGGLDNKIKLWSTLPITDGSKALDPNVPNLLCTLGLHNGSVLCVRWSNRDGRYLASGSDDQLLLIWEWDKSTEGWAGGSVFGSGEQNIENWKVVRRLTGHQSDVVDLAWSRDNTYLASCGLDNLVFIWDGRTFEKLHKLDMHQGFVKGVTWDPVGEFLATESDDKTVKVWRTSDWKIQAEISEPYASSPTTTFYRRLSWSPDGSHVATANGAQGPVPVAAIFNRGEWRPDVSLVGHDSAIEVVSFNPVIFMIPESDDADPESPEAASVGSVCAVGSQDHSISVWVTRNARPLFVCQKPFDHSVLDLAWSPDGTHLYACSYDGTVVVLQFLNNEFGTRLSMEEHDKILAKYGFVPKDPIILENTTQLSMEGALAIANKNSSSGRIAALMSDNQELPSPQPMVITDTVDKKGNYGSPSSAPSQTITLTKDGKKRIQPQFIRGLTSSPGAPLRPPMLTGNISSPTMNGDLSSSAAVFSQFQQRPLILDQSSGLDAPSRSLPAGGIPTLLIGNKRKESFASEIASQSNKRQSFGKSRTDSVIETEGHVLRSGLVPPSVTMSQVRLASHKVKDYLAKERLDGTTLKLECFNNSAKGPSQIVCTRGKVMVWVDYVPSSIILLTGHSQYSAVACEDGSLFIYSSAGRRLLPVIMLESAASFLEICREYLLCITQTGLISIWDLRNLKAIVGSVSTAPILQAATLSAEDFHSAASIISACVRPNGVPLLVTSLNEAWSYHLDMNTWVRVYDPRYSTQDPSNSETSEVIDGSILASLESMARQRGGNIGSLAYLRYPGGKDTQGKAHVIGHLENQLVSAEMVNSPTEYKRLLFAYAQQLADEGAEFRLHEICMMLLGPVNGQDSYTNNQILSNWDPFIMGMSKRQLLKEILPILSSNRTLQRHVTEYGDALKKILKID
ncbi:11228_t:CDS:10 [Funneliformis geosporum]|nr:11228_t:CDS:10 [Funneliformis geosporum]